MKSSSVCRVGLKHERKRMACKPKKTPMPMEPMAPPKKPKK